MAKIHRMKLTQAEREVQWAKIGQNIRSYRTKRKLSQEAMAQKAGYPLVYVGLVERGQRPAPVHTLSAIARALNCKLSDLFKGV